MLPLIATKNFVTLAEQYRDFDIEFPRLKGITLAHWGVESAWGLTKLAKVHGNYADMRWTPADSSFGSPVLYGGLKYTQFTGVSAFIAAYWNRFDEVAALQGWREKTAEPEKFIRFLAQKWPSESQIHVRNVIDTYTHRTKEFFHHATAV